jgi:hypothetical protein
MWPCTADGGAIPGVRGDRRSGRVRQSAPYTTAHHPSGVDAQRLGVAVRGQVWCGGMTRGPMTTGPLDGSADYTAPPTTAPHLDQRTHAPRRTPGGRVTRTPRRSSDEGATGRHPSEWCPRGGHHGSLGERQDHPNR